MDKEFLRLWFRDRCDPYKDEVRRFLFFAWQRLFEKRVLCLQHICQWQGVLGCFTEVQWVVSDRSLATRCPERLRDSAADQYIVDACRLHAVLPLHDPCSPALCRPQVLPEAPAELVAELSRRYVFLYERITGEKFVPPASDKPVAQRIAENLADYLR